MSETVWYVETSPGVTVRLTLASVDPETVALVESAAQRSGLPIERQPLSGAWHLVGFNGGSIDGEERYVKAEPEIGDRWEMMGTGETYVWDGDQFDLVGPELA